MIIQRIVTIIDHTVVIQVFQLHIPRIPDSFVGGFNQFLSGMVINFFLRLEQTFGYISPDFAYSLTFVIVAQTFCRVIVSVYFRCVIR